MRTRTPVTVPTPVIAGSSVGTVLSVPESRHEQITTAWRSSGKSWPEWLQEAIDLLSREEESEIHSLVTTVPATDADSIRISLRLFPQDMKRVKALAQKHSVSQRNVLLMAASLRAMQVTLNG